MQLPLSKPRRARAVVISLAALFSATAWADSSMPFVTPPPLYKQECAACHVAYPAGLLPAASWKRVMGSLNKHYGTDASLDDASLKSISGWLASNAGTYKRASEEPPQDRITKSAWFLRKHREGEVPADVWKRASVGSPANCVACHANAAQGSFNERDIKIPK